MASSDEDAERAGCGAASLEDLGARFAIRKVLIACNGMAATKAIRSMRSWAYESGWPLEFVCLATDDDVRANSAFLADADARVRVPAGPSACNYGNVQLICEVAQEHGCDAVWPGWGHASENWKLPKALQGTGVHWIGPGHKAMLALGDKIGSTIIAQSVDVPCVPWSGSEVRIDGGLAKNARGKATQGTEQVSQRGVGTLTAGATVEATSPQLVSDLLDETTVRMACLRTAEEAEAACERIGYPCMIKASAGGGGKGIRRVDSSAGVATAFRQVVSEVKNSLVFAMRMLEGCRHLEVQLVGDLYGDVTALGSRDCSVQRRCQKVIEEGPVTAAPAETVRAMEAAAERLARAVGYAGAATCEFLYAPDGRFYFLEINARLQVEHVVTECNWALNLPAAQLLVAMGVPLARIRDVARVARARAEGRFGARAHVIAARVTAEYAEAGFTPTAGRVEEISFRSDRSVWAYWGVAAPGGVHAHSDSQFGHVFASGPTRGAARRALAANLRRASVRGDIRNNIEALVAILEHPDYVNNDFHTTWLEPALKKLYGDTGDQDFFAPPGDEPSTDDVTPATPLTMAPNPDAQLPRLRAVFLAALFKSWAYFRQSDLDNARRILRGQASARLEPSYAVQLELDGVVFTLEGRYLGANAVGVRLGSTAVSASLSVVRALQPGDPVAIESTVGPGLTHGADQRALVPGATADAARAREERADTFERFGGVFLVYDGPDGRALCVAAQPDPAGLRITADHKTWTFTTPRDRTQLVAPVSGRLVRWLAPGGTLLQRGAAFAEVEVMKMYMPLHAEHAGVLQPLVQPGAALKAGQPLARLAPAPGMPPPPAARPFAGDFLPLIARPARVGALTRNAPPARMNAANRLSVAVRALTDAFHGHAYDRAEIEASLNTLFTLALDSRVGYALLRAEIDKVSMNTNALVDSKLVDYMSAQLEEAPAKAALQIRAVCRHLIAVCETEEPGIDGIQVDLCNVGGFHVGRGERVPGDSSGVASPCCSVAHQLATNGRPSCFTINLTEPEELASSLRALEHVCAGLAAGAARHVVAGLLEALLTAEAALEGADADGRFVTAQRHIKPVEELLTMQRGQQNAAEKALIADAVVAFISEQGLLDSSGTGGRTTGASPQQRTPGAPPTRLDTLKIHDQEQHTRLLEAVQGLSELTAPAMAAPALAAHLLLLRRARGEPDRPALLAREGAVDDAALTDTFLLSCAGTHNQARAAYVYACKQYMPIGGGAGAPAVTPRTTAPHAYPHLSAQGPLQIAYVLDGETPAPADRVVWLTTQEPTAVPHGVVHASWSSGEGKAQRAHHRTYLDGAELACLRGVPPRNVDTVCALMGAAPGTAPGAALRSLRAPHATHHCTMTTHQEACVITTPSARTALLTTSVRAGATLDDISAALELALVAVFQTLDKAAHSEGHDLLVEIECGERGQNDAYEGGPPCAQQILSDAVRKGVLTNLDMVDALRVRYARRFAEHGIAAATVRVRAAARAVRVTVHNPTGQLSRKLVEAEQYDGGWKVVGGAEERPDEAPSDVATSDTPEDTPVEFGPADALEGKGKRIEDFPESRACSADLARLVCDPRWQKSVREGPRAAEPLRRARAAAARADTTYVHDFPALFRECDSSFACVQLALTEDGDALRPLMAHQRAYSGIGMTVWYCKIDARDSLRAGREPSNDTARVDTIISDQTPLKHFIIVANDITVKIATFGTWEDRLWQLGARMAVARGLPLVYLSVNSGARMGLSDAVLSRIRARWVDPSDVSKGLTSIYLEEADYEALPEGSVLGEWTELTPQEQAIEWEDGCGPAASRRAFVISDIIGPEADLGVENLAASGALAGAMSRAYAAVPTLTFATGRSVGIGAYLARLGARVVQKRVGAPLLLTGHVALNELIGRDVYASNEQLGGVDIMHKNGTTATVVENDLQGCAEIIRWLQFLPSTMGGIESVSSGGMTGVLGSERAAKLDPMRAAPSGAAHERDHPPSAEATDVPADGTPTEPASTTPDTNISTPPKGHHETRSSKEVADIDNLYRSPWPDACPDRPLAEHGAAPEDVRTLLDGPGALFDEGSWREVLDGWARGVVAARARLAGASVAVVAVETRATTHTAPADPALDASHETSAPRAAQVWFPDSAHKTAQAIRDFAREGLPLFILANWRGFSGGQRDMFDEVLKFGATIVDALAAYRSPVFVYMPPGSELRGGAWVVVDKRINPTRIEMYADPSARANVMEPSGMVNVRFRARALAALARRVLPRGTSDAQGALQQAALLLADMHGTPARMRRVGAVDGVVAWRDARRFFAWRLRRALALQAAHAALKRNLAPVPPPPSAAIAHAIVQAAPRDADDRTFCLWLANHQQQYIQCAAKEYRTKHLARVGVSAAP